jgi:hypothetical protein
MADIKFIGICEASQLTGLPEQTIRVGLQQGVFPWGYAIRRKSTWSYYINREKLIQTERVRI